MRPETMSPSKWHTRQGAGLACVFFLSGAAALVYQICWQRVLFGAFGIDIESVTIIVSTFMLGLGIGAIAGGMLADRYPQRMLPLFAASEAGIGLFGLFSMGLIRAAGEYFVDSPAVLIFVINFLLLLVPTSMMGATLPMLVVHTVRQGNAVGVSVGGLYFANTLGAAFGSYLIGFVWLLYYTLQSAVVAAAVINLALAAVVAATAWRLK